MNEFFLYVYLKLIKTIPNIVFIILVFLYLFAYGQKYFGIPISVFLSVMSLIYLGYTRLFLTFLKVWKQEILLILIIVFYMLGLEELNHVESYLNRFSFYVLRILVDGILPAYVLANFSKKIKMNFRGFVFVLLTVLIIEILFATSMALSSEFKRYIYVYINGYDDQNVLMRVEWFFFRGFGIAYTYFAWFPFSLALILWFCVYSNVIRSKLFLIFLIFAIFLMISFNARIGYVPLLFGGIVYIVFYGKYTIKNSILFMMAMILVVFLLNNIDSGQYFPRLYRFKQNVIDNGLFSIFNVKGSVTIRELSNYKLLTDFNYFDYLFGKGELLTPKMKGIYTDVGYLQILYVGGIVLSFFLYKLFYCIFKRLSITVNVLCNKIIIPKIFIYYPIFMVLSFIVGNWKLRIFEINEATRFLLLVISLFTVFSEDGYTERQYNE